MALLKVLLNVLLNGLIKWFSVLRFCDTILEEDYTASMLKTKPHLKQESRPGPSQDVGKSVLGTFP